MNGEGNYLKAIEKHLGELAKKQGAVLQAQELYKQQAEQLKEKAKEYEKETKKIKPYVPSFAEELENLGGIQRFYTHRITGEPKKADVLGWKEGIKAGSEQDLFGVFLNYGGGRPLLGYLAGKQEAKARRFNPYEPKKDDFKFSKEDTTDIKKIGERVDELEERVDAVYKNEVYKRLEDLLKEKDRPQDPSKRKYRGRGGGMSPYVSIKTGGDIAYA